MDVRLKGATPTRLNSVHSACRNSPSRTKTSEASFSAYLVAALAGIDRTTYPFVNTGEHQRHFYLKVSGNYGERHRRRDDSGSWVSPW
jgi:hypothetical protein